MEGLLNDAVDFFYHPVKKDEAGGNMKGSGRHCWKNYAIKASFI